MRGLIQHWLCVQSSDSAAREQLEKVVEVLDTERCTTFEDCIAWARHRFQVSMLRGLNSSHVLVTIWLPCSVLHPALWLAARLCQETP